MVEGVGNLVYIFNRRPIVFKKLIIFLRAILLNSSFMQFVLFYQNVLDWVLVSTWTFWERAYFKNEGVSQSGVSNA